MRINNKEEAYRLFEKIEHSNTREFKQEALPFLADEDMLDSNYALARERYGRFMKIAESKDQVLRARVGLLRSSEKLGATEAIMEHSTALLAMDQLTSNLQTEAELAQARIYFEQENWTQSFILFVRVKDASAGNQKADAFYNLALIRHRQEFYDSSNSLINQMIEALPSYREWKMKALLLMSRNFWKLDDIFQANYIIDFIISSDADSALVGEAKRLRADIQKAEARAIAEKEALLEEQNTPVILDEGDIELIDSPGFDEPEEEPEVIEK